jgi:hypothetical protein
MQLKRKKRFPILKVVLPYSRAAASGAVFLLLGTLSLPAQTSAVNSEVYGSRTIFSPAGGRVTAPVLVKPPVDVGQNLLALWGLAVRKRERS